MELKAKRIKYSKKPEVDIFSMSGEKAGTYIPDLVIEERIIVEIKVQRCLMERSIDQLIKYLEKSKYEVGYLVNFGTSYTQIIRRIFSNKRKGIVQTGADDADFNRRPIAD